VLIAIASIFLATPGMTDDMPISDMDQRSKLSWGIYQILWSPEQFERELSQQLNLLGGAPKYVLFFRDLSRDRGFPRQVVEICARKNLIPVISFEPAPWHARDNADGLGDIADGRWDTYFKQWGLAAARWNKTVIFRFGFEMNGGWFSWGQQPKKFKQAWRRIHHLFRQAAATNIKWMFSPNVAAANSGVLQDPLTYYPGHDVVDFVGLDGYNFGDHYDRWHRWQRYEEIFEPSLTRLARLNKPLFLSEIGCADDRRKPAWMNDFLNRVAADQRITAFIYYNYYPKARGYPNWRLDSDDISLQVFRNWAAEQKNNRDGQRSAGGH